jgi:hypothetical protein
MTFTEKLHSGIGRETHPSREFGSPRTGPEIREFSDFLLALRSRFLCHPFPVRSEVGQKPREDSNDERH